MKELDSKQRAFVIYASKVLEATNANELDNKIQALTQDELTTLTTSFDEIYNQQMEDNTLLAKLGAKLNYIKKLNNKCPEGFEIEYFKAGGKTCSRCARMKDGAIPAKVYQKGSKVISDIKGEITKDKCGSKMKKKKMQEGGKYDPKEHDALVKKYQAGKIKDNSPEHKRLQELNRSPKAGHNESATRGSSISAEKNKKTTKVKKNQKGGLVPKRITFARGGTAIHGRRVAPRPTSHVGTSDPAILWGRTEDETVPRELPEVVVEAPKKKVSNLGGGLYEWMSKNGLGSKASYAERRKLAKQYGLENYKGTAEQNNQLMEILKQQLTLGQTSNGRLGLRPGIDY